jgi:membrane protease subunit (stomatin/prohibitin family)
MLLRTHLDCTLAGVLLGDTIRLDEKSTARRLGAAAHAAAASSSNMAAISGSNRLTGGGMMVLELRHQQQHSSHQCQAGISIWRGKRLNLIMQKLFNVFAPLRIAAALDTA